MEETLGNRDMELTLEDNPEETDRRRRKEEKEKHKGKFSHENILFSLRTGYTCRAPRPNRLALPRRVPDSWTNGALCRPHRCERAPQPGARGTGDRRRAAAQGTVQGTQD